MRHLVDPKVIPPGKPLRMRPVTKSPIDVSAAVAEIDAQPKLWNQYVLRTKGYETPHSRIDDIWVRYRDFAEYKVR